MTGRVHHTAISPARYLPIWLLLVGNGVMMASFWLIGAGGMMAKLILLVFWLVVLSGSLKRGRLSPGGLIGGLVLCALVGVILFGNGITHEKFRLVGNLLMMPVGLACGLVIGRDCLRILMPAMALYLLLASSFYLTHEGVRLNHAFLFLGFFALCSVCGGAWGRPMILLAALAVLISQTRIAVLAMLINGIGLVRISRVSSWLVMVVCAGLIVWASWQYLPRLFMIHDSGRLAFWQMFAEIWQRGSETQRWLGFGAGAVEEILSGSASFASFGALHNDHFRILFELGLIGAVLWLAGWGLMIWLVRGTWLSVMILVSVLVTMVTDNSLNYGHYLIACAMAAGIAAREGVRRG
jgi:hypothetical protein